MRPSETEWSGNWHTHVTAIGIGVFAFVISILLPDGYSWGGCIAAAAAALILPSTVYYRTFTTQLRFWTTFSLLAVAQVPLVIFAKPLADQGRFLFILLFGVADCVAVIVVFSRVRPLNEPNEEK